MTAWMLELMVTCGPAFEALPKPENLKMILGESLVIRRGAA